MKKVLFVITRLAAGGAPSVTLSMLKSLRENGYDVELATGLAGKGERDLLPEIKDKDYKVTVIPELVRNVRPLKDLIALGKLRKLMKEGKYDVVHTHTTKAGILGRLAANQAKVPHVIHSPHGHIFHGYFNPVLIKLYVMLETMAARWTQKTITLTEKEKKEYLALGIGVPGEYECIYNGIDVDKYCDPDLSVKAERRRLNISTTATVLLTVGRLVHVKGHRHLLEAVASMGHEESADVHCLIIGDGDLREELESQAHELGISEKISFLGHQNNITPFLMISDLFVLPSLNEGFGLVVIEAMASGLPIIATNVGGVPEIVKDGETGILVSPGESSALKNGILTLLKDREILRQIGNQNRERVQREFSLKQMNDKVEKLYDEVLAER